MIQSGSVDHKELAWSESLFLSCPLFIWFELDDVAVKMMKQLVRLIYLLDIDKN